MRTWLEVATLAVAAYMVIGDPVGAFFFTLFAILILEML